MSNFNHLHVHTEYSALDGLSKISELIDKAKSMGQTAIPCCSVYCHQYG